MEWKDSRDLIAGWAVEKGYQVNFLKGGDNSICSESKSIEINSNGPIENQVYVLLHECGHLLIFSNKAHYFRDVEEKFSKRSSTYKIFTIIEEVEAWKRGKKLGQKLGIKINEDKWGRMMVRALKSYVDWAS